MGITWFEWHIAQLIWLSRQSLHRFYSLSYTYICHGEHKHYGKVNMYLQYTIDNHNQAIILLETEYTTDLCMDCINTSMLQLTEK